MRKLLIFFLYIIIFFLFPALTNASENSTPKYMWYRDIPNEDKDYYVAFRGQLNITSESDCEIQLLGASWFVGWFDGKYFCEGPARFPADYPEYQTYKIHLSKGHHTLAIQIRLARLRGCLITRNHFSIVLLRMEKTGFQSQLLGNALG